MQEGVGHHGVIEAFAAGIRPAYDMASLWKPTAAAAWTVDPAPTIRCTVCNMVRPSPTAVAFMSRRSACATMLASALPGAPIRSQQGPVRNPPGLLDCCFQSVGAHQCQSVGSGLLVPLRCAGVPVAYNRCVPAFAIATQVTKVEDWSASRPPIDVLARTARRVRTANRYLVRAH